MVPCRVKEEARKADKQLTLVPIIFLFLRSWSMIRFCIYLASSAQQSQSLLDAQEILIYLQVSVLYFCLSVDMSRRSISLQAGFIKSAAGGAFLRPREDMRRIGERFAGGVALISVRPPLRTSGLLVLPISLERFGTSFTWNVNGKSDHVTTMFPLFFTFAVCAVPFLRESKLLRVCCVHKIFLQFSLTE